MPDQWTDIITLKKYSDILDGIRCGESPAKKGYYLVLYHFVIPLFRFFRPFLKLFIRKAPKVSCDILVLGTCFNDIAASSHIWDALSDKGFRLYRMYMRRKIDFFRYALYSAPLKNLPSSLYLQACFARYLVEHYDPRMIAVFYSYDVLPSFLRMEMAGKGKTVYIPHAVIPTTYIYTSVDFDYYLVFGKSSLDNLLHQKILVGHTQAIRVGSPMIKKDFYLPPSDSKNRTILYFSNWLVGVDPSYTTDFNIVLQWAKDHPEFNLIIKLHPVESGKYVRNAAANISNILILDPSVTIREATAKAALTIVAFSVASIESALMNRPVVVANHRPYDPDSDDAKVSDKFLFLEKYFPSRATSPGELHERIMEVYSRYDYYVKQCARFVKHHLEHGVESEDHIIALLEDIFRNKESISHTEVRGTFRYK